MKRPLVKLIMKLLLVTLILSTVSACGAVDESNTVTEEFRIFEIDSEGNVHGELTQDTGEGIFYEKSYLESKLVDGELKEGDVITVTWWKGDYENEEWDNVVDVSRGN